MWSRKLSGLEFPAMLIFYISRLFPAGNIPSPAVPQAGPKSWKVVAVLIRVALYSDKESRKGFNGINRTCPTIPSGGETDGRKRARFSNPGRVEFFCRIDDEHRSIPSGLGDETYSVQPRISCEVYAVGTLACTGSSWPALSRLYF